MVSLKAKTKKGLIISGSVLTGIGISYVTVVTLFGEKYVRFTTTPTKLERLRGSFILGGAELIIPGIVCLSIGLAAKTK